MLEPSLSGKPFSQCSSYDLAEHILCPVELVDICVYVDGTPGPEFCIYIAQCWAKEILKDRGNL